MLTEFPPRFGGMQTHALYLVRYLAQRGYPVEVATYQPSSDEERAAVGGFDGRLGVPVHRRLSRLAYWHSLGVLTDIGRRFGPDLIYCSNVYYGFLGERLGVPVLCRSVGNDVLRPWIAYPFRPASRLLASPAVDEQLYRFFRRLDYPEAVEALFRRQRRELMKASARQMDLVIANSDFTSDVLHTIGVSAGRVRQLVGGVDAERFGEANGQRRGAAAAARRAALGIPADAHLLTTACRLVAKKGVDFLLRSFVGLHQRMGDAHLLVIGDGRHAGRHRRLAESLGIGSSVTFVGQVPHEQIHHLYWISDLFVLSSRLQRDPRTGIVDAETMGRVLCEANAAGVPTVAARTGGIPSVITDEVNGLLFEPEDEASFIDCVLRMREDRALAERLVETGCRLAKQKFDWSVILAQHECFFADALRGR